MDRDSGFWRAAALGLARLALGMWSIHQLRAGSLPVDDRDMIDMVEVLRAELSCSSRVEVRESIELTTPATVGWKRPLLFLPARLAELEHTGTTRGAFA